ncbi:RabGAP TBC [Ephemerocybe angulata]|uniref:RabGAP TBC n=2 Tax=Ephemerocybe angulata TaxID=980116 RepID=A0A8H6HF48_9AGAR|nr:RabGAP TBC [Tulosesus angulatus]
MSINSLGGNRSPTIDAHHTSWISAGSGSGGLAPPSPSPYAAPRQVPAESETQMEAHRNRELKWMSLLSTSQPSQARKSKKIRKLLLDGVPSSVRYLVWSHLTDGKARCVPGVYTQLCKRGRVPVSEEMEKDVNAERGWFGAQDQLKVLAEAGGGVVQLLQAYLNMVPDIQYTLGLPHIVGQLLLLAPEEDAFWIFISIMDTHIRPYFSSGSTQLEVDSALFARALEVNDAAVAKKLLVDMGISPSLICAPWFSSLYVGCLPPEYLVRTWDLFLYDGIPFLIRVGLAIIAFVRRQVLECTSEEAVLAILHHPPASNLPPTPENYLSFVQSIKLKDDDVRKQRIKMEAQVKRQTQQGMARMGAGTTGSISLPRA